MSYQTAPNDAAVADPRLSEAEEEQLQLLYDQLKPEAVRVYLNYFLARTPAHLQYDMQDLIKDDIAVPPTPPPPETLSRDNFGAPTHQLVDVEAVAQAAAHTPGSRTAHEAREEALDNRAPNPANAGKPLVNVRPGDDGPVVVSVDEANPASGQGQAQAREIPRSEQTREGEPIPETYNNPVDGQYRRDQ